MACGPGNTSFPGPHSFLGIAEFPKSFLNGVFHRCEADTVDLLLLALGDKADGEIERQAVGRRIQGQRRKVWILFANICQQVGENCPCDSPSW